LYKILDEKKTESTTKTLYRDTKEMDEVKEDDKIETRRSVGMGMSASASKSQGKLTV